MLITKEAIKTYRQTSKELKGLSIECEKIEVTQYNWQEEITAKIKNGFAVNLVLEGAYNHFTVIAGVSDTKFELFDSLSFKWVRKDNCCLRDKDNKFRHHINSKSLIAIGI